MPPRKTHDYPQGKPWPNIVVEIVIAVVGVLWLAFGRQLAAAIVIVAAFICLGFIYWKLHQRFEDTGDAVRRPERKKTVFLGKMPASLRALRYGFLPVGLVLLIFGLVPMPAQTAERGIIVCILTLFVMALAYVLLISHYVRTGRAIEK